MSLKEKNDFIRPKDQTPRQRWGNGALQKHFHEQGRDLEISNPKKDIEGVDFLCDAGYSPEEISLIIRHFNAVVEWINNQDKDTQHLFSNTIEAGIRRQTLPPVPPPKNG